MLNIYALLLPEKKQFIKCNTTMSIRVHVKQLFSAYGQFH